MSATPPRLTTLHLASGNGPITRPVLDTPLRDALPSEIPIIDVSGASSPSPAARRAVAAEVRAAATTSGFFYIANHGIPEPVIAAARDAALAFFRRDPGDKMRAHAERSRHFNGYKPPGSLRINKAESVDARESFSWAYDPAYDPSVPDLAAIPPAAAALLRGGEDFHWRETADIAPALKPAMVAYWRACLALARRLIRTFALSLDLPEDYFDAKFAYPDATLTLNYYPPMPPQPPGDPLTQVSIGSHTDFQLFTMLWQDDAGGLQVLSRDGQWLRAAPVPGTMVVNIADYMQRITNDLYVSTVHRAQNLSGRERLSMPFFFGFGLHETCAVVRSCVRDGEEPKYDEIACAEWVRRRIGAMHKTDGAN